VGQLGDMQYALPTTSLSNQEIIYSCNYTYLKVKDCSIREFQLVLQLMHTSTFIGKLTNETHTAVIDVT